ncbi:tetratricopeptide repeat protein [Candidatus Spongiihabitans sp.]|uniref:tetratricopeptide repeat protein n=1 Tax=Candidatus Spongiihabitans sp. TaxID=3101308 RepID=UPI003C6FDC42
MAFTAAAQTTAEQIEALRKEAEQGNADAQYYLYLSFAYTSHPHDGRRWLRKAADQGNAWAQYDLGNVYENGEGVAEDKREAVRWYRKAAEQRHPEAQYMVARAYWDGDGIAKDQPEAVRWFHKVAEQRNARFFCRWRNVIWVLHIITAKASPKTNVKQCVGIARQSGMRI